MPEWQGPSHLHWELKGEHVLFSFVTLDSLWGFLLASLMLGIICVLERIVSHYHDQQKPLSTSPLSQSLWSVFWRCLLYWIAMVFRLCYMLATMTFNMGIIVVIAATLTIAQCIIDLRSSRRVEGHSFQRIDRRLPSTDGYNFPRITPTTPVHDHAALTVVVPNTHPKSKSKPDSIYIHPSESNVARADAMADHLNLNEPTLSNVDEWGEGKGRGVARPTLQPSRGCTTPTHRKSASCKNLPFNIGEEESDSDNEDVDPARRRLVS